MWKLSIEDDQGNKTVVKLVRDEYTLGRSEENAIRLTERNISRRHATLRKNGVGWLISDRTSYNGCFVNGSRVNQNARLEHGDLVQLGDYRLTVIDERLQPIIPDTGDAPSSLKVDSTLGQPDRFVMLVGPTPGTEFALRTERVVIGRGEECDIPVNHSSVSRVHAEVQALGQGRYEIIDLGSSNGVRVNGIELQRSLIHPRDVIELGDVILKFIPAGEYYKPTAEESQQIGALSAALAGHSATRMVPTSAKIVAGVVGLGLLMVLGVIIFGRRTDPPMSETAVVRPVDKTVKALSEAKALLVAGDVEGAHAKALRDVPEGSNARESSEFREIEARWADHMFERAGSAEDPAQRQELLEQIARTTTVDNVRRKRANTALEELAKAAEDEGLAVTDLPNVPRAPGSPQQPVAAIAQVPKASAPKPASASEPRTTRTATSAGVSDGLVRDNPFDSSGPAPAPSDSRTSEMATSGDRRQAIAAKNALKTKVANGTATEQEIRLLRALCRQLSDTSCID
jgi:pSer/pThr/pTyr-binding forkhead associated (FHA) protein